MFVFGWRFARSCDRDDATPKGDDGSVPVADARAKAVAENNRAVLDLLDARDADADRVGRVRRFAWALWIGAAVDAGSPTGVVPTLARAVETGAIPWWGYALGVPCFLAAGFACLSETGQDQWTVSRRDLGSFMGPDRSNEPPKRSGRQEYPQMPP